MTDETAYIVHEGSGTIMPADECVMLVVDADQIETEQPGVNELMKASGMKWIPADVMADHTGMFQPEWKNSWPTFNGPTSDGRGGSPSKLRQEAAKDALDILDHLLSRADDPGHRMLTQEDEIAIRAALNEQTTGSLQ